MGLTGLYYKHQGRLHDAVAIFAGLYEEMLSAQHVSGEWMAKGKPLVWMSDCYRELNCPALAKRYLMLTLCEDAIRDEGKTRPGRQGSYLRLAWSYGMGHSEIRRYFKEAYAIYQSLRVGAMSGCALFPEAILHQLDQGWMTEFPAPAEAYMYPLSRRYAKCLYERCGSHGGRALEQLAEYLLSVMPGCRTSRRVRTPSTELDIVCSMMGFDLDFRSELGRYFVCECKDWKEPAGFPVMAKLCRVLDSVKARFGILFSRRGITGVGKTRDAEREQLNMYQDRGVVIVVVDEEDVRRVIEGANLIALLRAKYEGVRLDLVGDPKAWVVALLRERRAWSSRALAGRTGLSQRRIRTVLKQLGAIPSRSGSDRGKWTIDPDLLPKA